MPPAARVGDSSGHGGTVVGPGVSTVIIGGRPAAVAGDTHVCPLPYHGATPVTRGSASVLIGGRPAARGGDTAGRGAPITSGAFNVIIGG